MTIPDIIMNFGLPVLGTCAGTVLGIYVGIRVTLAKYGMSLQFHAEQLKNHENRIQRTESKLMGV